MRFLLKLPDRLSRELMQLIDKDYIKNKHKKRKGRCKKCGQCCKKCRFLNNKTNLCRVYDNRPLICYKEFPLDKLDQNIWNVKECGYSFH